MSNPLAIAAVTESITRLLFNGVNAVIPGTTVSARPLDKARNGVTGNQLNVYLYQAVPNPSWRNLNMPRQVRPGETAFPPLALDLFYLITAYGNNDEDSQGHRVLGYAMSILNDHPLLSADEIEAALPQSDLDQQIERVRISLQTQSMDDLSKLWSAFQTQYRTSAAYQVSVVLIESARPIRAALPVLRRGEEDRGPIVIASPPPFLTALSPPIPQPAIRQGEDLTMFGQNLDQEGITVRFTHPRLTASQELSLMTGGSSRQAAVHLPSLLDDANALVNWAPGFYTLTLVVRREDLPTWTSNSQAFALAPTITVSPLTGLAGDVTLTLTCSPRIQDDQSVSLLFAERQVIPQTITTPVNPLQPTTLTFLVEDVEAGEYVVRLRVDGVDSLPFERSGTPPQLVFAANQKVTIT